MTYRIFSFACSDVGRVRDNNQDSFALDRELHLYLVADGMGGYAGGEVASRLAVDVIDAHLRAVELSDANVGDELARAVREANRAIYARRQADPAVSQMGTTATGIVFHEERALIAHVGDSRCYLLRGGAIHQITDDHSFVWHQLKAGLITEADARRHPYRNVITRSVGVEPEVEVDMAAVSLQSGDAFLLCSDGLSGLVNDAEINAVVEDNFLHRVPELLVDLANERGGGDNITVVLAYAIDEADLPTWVDLAPRGS
jgi:protein phosphatase